MLVGRLNSQTVCGLGYDFNYSTTAGGCDYTFTPVIPGGAPSIAWFEWVISSTGTYGVECDRLDGNPLYYTFCFYGYHKVTMIIHFTSGLPCKVEKTIYVTCSNALLCDPDPSTGTKPVPVVEITYIDPASCNITNAPILGCMYDSSYNSSTMSWVYANSCGWHWAIKIPANQYNCEIFNFKIEYYDLGTCSDSTLTCHQLYPGVTYCIFARLNKKIKIVAEANHCCLPANYKRGFEWQPIPNNSPGIYDPDPTFGICTYRCTQFNIPCNENQNDIDLSGSSVPSISCFRGETKGSNWLKGKVVDKLPKNSLNTDLKLLEKYAGIQTNLVFWNLNGELVFKGNLEFISKNVSSLNWPNEIVSGIYLVQFINEVTNETIKLYKP